jgi:hypothetical protein
MIVRYFSIMYVVMCIYWLSGYDFERSIALGFATAIGVACCLLWDLGIAVGGQND